MRRGVVFAVALVLIISMLLSVLLFQLTQPGSTILGTTVITTTKTIMMPNPAFNSSQPGQVILETYNWNVLTSLVLTLRNAGPNPVVFADWYIDGESISASGDCVGAGTILSAEADCSVTLAYQQMSPQQPSGYFFTPSIPYTVKVVTADGQIFSYCIIAGDSDTTPQSMNDCTQPKIIMEAYYWLSLTSLILTVRNIGPVQVILTDFFVNGIGVTVTNPCGGALSVGSTCTLTLPVAGQLSISAGVAYVIKVVTLDGAVFSFTAIAGESA